MKGLQFRDTLKNPSFFNLWVSQFISAFGDGIWLITLPLLVLEMTGNKVMVGVIAFIELLPLVFSFFIGPFIDRLNKKIILLICDIGRGFILLVLATLYFMELLNVPTIAICAFLLSLQSMFFTPTKTALVPVLVNKKELDKAVSFMNTSEMSALIIGKLFSGVLITIVSSEILFLIDGFTFLISGFFIFLVRFKDSKTDLKEKLTFKEDLKEGISKLKENSNWITSIKYFFLVNLIITGLISVIGPILSLERFDKSYSIWFSLMYVSFQAGMLSGNLAVFFNWNTKRLLHLYPKAMLILGVMLIILSFPLNGAECFIFFLLGLTVSYIDIQTILYFQKTIPERYAGRIFSLIFSIIKMGEPLSAGLYTLLLLLIPTNSITLLFGVVMSICFFLILIRNSFPKDLIKKRGKTI